jgi:hypothetical protein
MAGGEATGDGNGGKKKRERKKISNGVAATARSPVGESEEYVAAGNSAKSESSAVGSKSSAMTAVGEVIIPEKKAVMSWDDKVRMLEDFNQLHGHVCVPKHDAELGWWVQQCRQMHNSGKMPEEKRERLERLGFVWCGQEAKRIREQAEGKTVSSWDDRFRTLMEFREVHGHTCVPMQRHDPGLGAWVKEQRSLNNAGKLQEERKQKLISIGFIFDGAEAKRIREQAEGKPASTWDDKFQMLETFKEKHGHSCVPLQRNDPGLGCWVREQRSLFNSGKLQESRREKLASLGFIFDGGQAKKVREQSEGKACHSWNDKFKLLEMFKEKNGHTCVPKQEAELGWWVQQCRQLYNSSKLADDKRERLEAIGFVFDGSEAKRVRDSFQGKPTGGWDDKLKLLREFKVQNGHTCVAQKHPTLGFWVKEQRMALNKGRLSEERRQKLDELGFTWDARRKVDEDGSSFHSPGGLEGAMSGGLGSTAFTGSQKLGEAMKPKLVSAKKNVKPASLPIGLLIAQEASFRSASAVAFGAGAARGGSEVALGTAPVNINATKNFSSEMEEERKASLDFLCNPEKRELDAALAAARKNGSGWSSPNNSTTLVADNSVTHQHQQDFSEHAGAPSVHLVPAQQRPDNDEAMKAVATVTAISAGIDVDDEMDEDSQGGEGGGAAGSKRSHNEVSTNDSGEKLGMSLGNGSRFKRSRCADIGTMFATPTCSGVAGALVADGDETEENLEASREEERRGEGQSSRMAAQGDAALAEAQHVSSKDFMISEAQELWRKSQQRCKYLVQMMRACQQHLYCRCQVNYRQGDEMMGCIPELETSRQTMSEYQTGASQTLNAAQLLCRNKNVQLKTEVCR